MVDDERMTKLVSKDGFAFLVPFKVARLSQLVENSYDVEDDDDDQDQDNTDVKEIPLPNVSTPVLKKVIEFCTHHETVEKMTPTQTPLKFEKLEELVQPFYANFVKKDSSDGNSIDRNMLFDLVGAANFMDIKPLLDLTCLAVAIKIKGMKAADLREMFNISSEMTSEEDTVAERANAAAAPEQP